LWSVVITDPTEVQTQTLLFISNATFNTTLLLSYTFFKSASEQHNTANELINELVDARSVIVSGEGYSTTVLDSIG